MILPIGHDKAVYGRPWFTIGVIGLCSFVQVLRTLLHFGGATGAAGELHPNDPIVWLGYFPDELISSGLLTSQFVHDGYLHLAGNMLFLWLTGASMEYRWGPKVWAAVYLVGGVVATFAYGLVHVGSTTPLIGASGAVAAAMGAFLVCEYGARIKFWYLYFFLFRLRTGTFFAPAYVALPLWFVWQLLMSLFETDAGGVAYSVHVAGFAFGAAVALLARVSGAEAWWRERIGSGDFDDEFALIRDGVAVPPLAVAGAGAGAGMLSSPSSYAPVSATTSATFGSLPPPGFGTEPPIESLEPNFARPNAQPMTPERFEEMLRWLDEDGMLVEGSKYIEHVARISSHQPEQACSLVQRVLDHFDLPYPLSDRALAIAARFAVRRDPALCMQVTRALIVQHPRSRFTPEAMLYAADVQRRAGTHDKARRTWQNIVAAYPRCPAAVKAREALEATSRPKPTTD